MRAVLTAIVLCISALSHAQLPDWTPPPITQEDIVQGGTWTFQRVVGTYLTAYGESVALVVIAGWDGRLRSVVMREEDAWKMVAGDPVDVMPRCE